MFSSGQNDKWKRGAAMNTFLMNPEERLSPCPVHTHHRNVDSPHGQTSWQQFQNMNGTGHSFFDEKLEAHGHDNGGRNCRNNYSNELSSLEMATLQLQHLIRQNELHGNHGGVGNGLESFFSPPATMSSSRSTMFSCNSAPPFVTHCPSPVASEDNFNRHFGSCDSISNFNPKNHASKFESTNGYFTKDGKQFEQGTIYTAEDVHTVVKNNRDGNKQRTVSNKVFVGGISHSMNRETINTFFGQFGTVFVDWPVKQKGNSARGKAPVSSYSYLFLVYSEEQSVVKLMNACHRTSKNEFFVLVPGCRDTIQIRPWFIKNAFYILDKARDARIVDIHRTVFVGGLPRIVTAEEIAQMFSEFGVVLLVTIDIDQDYGYPKGAARVTFERDSSFSRALEKKYLKFENIDSSKTLIEIKPYVMEDVGCDQCGGLWFNPFLDVYDQMNGCKINQNEVDKCCTQDFNVWPPSHRFSSHGTDDNYLESQDLLSKIDAEFQRSLNISATTANQEESEVDENEIAMGARKFLAMTKSYGLDKEKTVNILGTEYVVGPDLWNTFLPPPNFEVGNEPVQISPDQKIQAFLRMKQTNVYSNKSSYCKERPCRQYYCPSCSNKLHSGPNQHTLLPAGKPERRPRKDKNMYLVSLNN